MKKSRIAAIDIGTNSIRCIIAEAAKDGKFEKGLVIPAQVVVPIILTPEKPR